MKRQLENQKAQKGPLLASSSEGQWLSVETKKIDLQNDLQFCNATWGCCPEDASHVDARSSASRRIL